MVIADTALGMDRIDPDTDEHRLAYQTINQHADKVTQLVQEDRVRLQNLEAAETGTDPDRVIPSAGAWAVTVGGVRRSPGVDARYAAFPTTTVLPDGRLFMVWYEGTDHATTRDGIVRGSWSGDNGVTWSAAVTVLQIPGVDLRDPSVSMSRDGRVVYLAYFKASTTNAAAGFFVRQSTDMAETFGPESRIDGGQPFAAGCSPVVDLDNGLIMAAWYGKADLAEARESVWYATSPDGGLSWGVPVRLVDGVAPGLDMQEPWIVASGDTVSILHRRGNTTDIGQITSTNGGASWSADATRFPGTGRPSAVITSNGTLVVTYRIVHSSGQHGAMRYSRDMGATWSQPYVLERANPAWWLYSGPVEVARGLVFCPTSIEVSGTSAKLSARYLVEGGGFSPYGDNPDPVDRALTAGSSLAVLDDFDRPDGPLGVSVNGQDWVAPAAVAVNGGSLLDTTSNLANGNLSYANALTPDVDIEADVSWSGASGLYLVFRLQNTTNFLMAGIETNGTVGRIYKVVAGVATQLAASAAVTMPAGVRHKLRVSAVGNNIRLYLEDALIASVTDTTFNTMPWVGLRTGSGVASTVHRVFRFVVTRRSGLAS